MDQMWVIHWGFRWEHLKGSYWGYHLGMRWGFHWETGRVQHWGCLRALLKGSQTGRPREMEWVHWLVIQMGWSWGWSWEWQKGFHWGLHWDRPREDPRATQRETRTDWVLDGL